MSGGGLIAAVRISQKKIGLNGQIVLGPRPMLEGERTDLKLVSGYVIKLLGISFWNFFPQSSIFIKQLF
jgi:hypothetical protein